MSIATTKSERIETRVTKEQKDLLAYAASLEGRNMTDFIVESAQAAALRTIEERAMIRLSAEHQRRFAEAILEPAEPVEALKEAFAEYRKSCLSRP